VNCAAARVSASAIMPAGHITADRQERAGQGRPKTDGTRDNQFHDIPAGHFRAFEHKNST